jgi:hypothetical protein
VDLCFKLQEMGWSLVYDPRSVVIHFESQSGPERYARIRKNIDRLHQKWLGRVKPDLMIETDGSLMDLKAGCIRPYRISPSVKEEGDPAREGSVKTKTESVGATCS